MTKPIDVPDLTLLKGTVSEEILRATRIASRALSRAKIRHALIGGLAVGAYGYVRATKDVDFLVGDEAFASLRPFLTFRPEVPIEVNGIKVDTLSGDDYVGEAELNESLETDGIPIVTPEVLVYLKLKAWRRRDQEDVIELLRAGLDEKEIRRFIRARAPHLLPRLEFADRASRQEET